MIRKNSAIAIPLIGFCLMSLSMWCQAQTCLPPNNIQIALQANMTDETGQTIDSVYVQWAAPSTGAASYHYEVLLDGLTLFDNTSNHPNFKFSLMPIGWDILTVQLKTICSNGAESETRAATIVATIDEVYKIYQEGNCDQLGACSDCICNAIETILDDSTAVNGIIENSDFLGNGGCAPFLNRFLQTNSTQLQSLCPCFIPKRDCYDHYPCNGYNCATGLRETANNQFNWRVQNNATQESIIIEYYIPQALAINIVVYDLLGQRIYNSMPDKHPIVGLHHTEIKLPRKGIYFAEIQANNMHEVKQVIALW